MEIHMGVTVSPAPRITPDSIMRVDGFAMMPNFSFGTAMTTYAGQNVGAKMYDRVERGFTVCFFCSFR